MLTVQSLSKSYGVQPILKDISFSLNPGERLGLVGPNGSGKTTLLRILAGVERPDAGGFHFSPTGARLGYLPQGLTPADDDTIAGFLNHMAGDLHTLSSQLETLATALAHEPGRADLAAGYDATLQRLEAAAESAGQSAEVLAALGLDAYPPQTPVRTLSGGQKTRLALAGVLLSAPQVLLLDEPTNHLDIAMLEWLETWLSESRWTRDTALLIVSPDRAFLDRTVAGIL